MNDVSLQSSVNMMDALNLAIVLTPNLVSSQSPSDDVMICGAGSKPTLPPSLAGKGTMTLEERGTTLGTIVKFSIEHYYEVFDEVVDRSEAVPPSLLFEESLAPSGGTCSSGSSSPRMSVKLLKQQASALSSAKRESLGFDTDEDIDDAVLVMPVGPSTANGVLPSSASFGGRSAVPGTGILRPRIRNPLNRTAPLRTQSMYGDRTFTSGAVAAAVQKAQSTISIDKGASDSAPGSRRGSISVGRVRKSSGSGVEAISVSAAGFFTSPNSAPPVPPVPKATTGASSQEN